MEKKEKMPNNKCGNKKVSLVLILRALEECSDISHPIRQQDLAKMVNDLGGILDIDLWVDRKTVGRHIKTLKIAGYNIISVKGKGVYLANNNFTQSERVLLYKLICSSNLPNVQKQTLLNKLNAQQLKASKDIEDWKALK